MINISNPERIWIGAIRTRAMARDWKAYDARLRARGALSIDGAALDAMAAETRERNGKRRGGQYVYAESLILVAAYAHMYFRLPYRQVEGLLASVIGGRIAVPDHTTLCRRVNALDMTLVPGISKSGIRIAVDSSGIKVTCRGEWMREKHGTVRRGFIKIHIATDVEDGTVVGMVATDEGSHDSNHAVDLVEQCRSIATVYEFLGDGAYDASGIFEYCYDNGIVTAIRVRANSRCDTGSYPRRMSVRRQLGRYSEWKREAGYGRRWAVEGTFSAIKRLFGEHVMAHRRENMMHEMWLKIAIYNRMLAAA